MHYNINIYEEIHQLKQLLDDALLRIEVLEGEKEKILLEGFYTISEICLKYHFSRKSFYNYLKITPLKKSAKTGFKDKYKKAAVDAWYQEVIIKKEQHPELFIPNFTRKQAS
jgi:hypothetical protein